MFQRMTLVCATALALLPPLLNAQSKPVDRPDESAARPAAKSVDELIEQLGSADFQVRKAATKELVSRGAAVVDDLHAAAEDHDDAEVKMRAQRILERIAAGDDETRVGDGSKLRLRERAAEPRGGQQDPGLRDLRAELEEMRARIEEMMGGGMFGQDGDLDRLFEPGAGFRFAPSLIAPDFVKGQSVRIEVGPDRVRVEVDAKEGSDEESQVYEAPDMESFRAQHPEIAQRYLGGGLDGGALGGRLWLDVDGQQNQLRGLQRMLPRQGSPFGLLQPRAGVPGAPDPQSPPGEEIPPQGQRLGVFIETLDPAVAEFLGFEAGHGLRVTSIESGSLAATMGVMPEDVLMHIGGREIRQRGDVAAALGEIATGETIEVSVNRRGREVSLRAVKPSPEANGSSKQGSTLDKSTSGESGDGDSEAGSGKAPGGKTPDGEAQTKRKRAGR